MTSSESIGRHAGIDSGYVNFVQDGRERAAIGFANLQFFALIYLQKFALSPAPSFELHVPMLIMSASVGWMVVSHKLSFVASRVLIFLVFVSCCFFSESLVFLSASFALGGSLPSFMQVIVMYSAMTVCAESVRRKLSPGSSMNSSCS